MLPQSCLGESPWRLWATLHVHVRAGTARSAAWVLPGTHAMCLLLTCVPQRPDKTAQGHLCHQVRWGWALDSGPVKKG